MNATEYKKYHEAFMQNNHGTTELETFLCIFLTVQNSIFISYQHSLSPFKQYILEYIVMVLPMILAHTVLAAHIHTLNFIILFILCYNSFSVTYSAYMSGFIQLRSKNIFKNDRIPLISSLRGLTYLITGLCILAVDFSDFPRKLAKTERYGYSLMDTGVGLFVTMSGLVHKDIHRKSFKEIVNGNTKIVGILLFLGVGRFISVKLLDYQEHVSEYGVHWNFFFTIAVCKTISTILLYLSNHPLLLSIVTLIFHELVLYIGLKDWVFSDSPRDTLVSANREGISSCLGFVSIYLFAVHIKKILLNRNATKLETLVTLLQITGITCILMYWDLIQPTSRTLANAGYCIHINALLVRVTSVMYFTTVLGEEKDIQVPLILSTINTNGLTYFLIANLLTGAINLSMQTLFVPSSIALVILNVYMIGTIALVVYVKKLGFRI